jgi:hypothetical protein
MLIAKWASHDLRRTVATQMASLELPLDTIAIVIGQKAGSAGTQTLVKHYIHEEFLDRKRTALEAWDRRLRASLARAGCCK